MRAVIVAIAAATMLCSCAGSAPTLRDARVALNAITDGANTLGPALVLLCEAPPPEQAPRCDAARAGFAALQSGVNAMQDVVDSANGSASP